MILNNAGEKYLLLKQYRINNFPFDFTSQRTVANGLINKSYPTEYWIWKGRSLFQWSILGWKYMWQKLVAETADTTVKLEIWWSRKLVDTMVNRKQTFQALENIRRNFQGNL